MREALASARALVIDADPVARSAAVQALRAADFEVAEAADAASALAQLPRLRPALVVVDVELPGRDGISLCDAIRHLPSGSRAAVVVTTWLDQPGLIERAFAAGASDFVRKPVDAQLFAYRARFLVRSNEAQRGLREALLELQRSRASLADAQRIARIGSWQWAPDTGELSWSAEAQRIVPLPQDGAPQSVARYLALVHPGDAAGVEKAFAAASTEATPLDSEHRVRLAEDALRTVHLCGELQWDAAGRALVCGTVQDVTQRRESEERIHQLSHYDALTALPNRSLLTESLERALGLARERRERVAVLALGLDRFRRVNDAYGPALADEVLRLAARRIAACARSAEELAELSEPTLARIGGDEFLIAVSGVTAIAQVEGLARKLLRTLSRAMQLGSERVEMSATVGIALFPDDGHDASRLVQNATAAMQQAKRTERGAYRFYSAQLSAEAARALEVERWLRRALERGEGLSLDFQPQLSAASGAGVGVEALARMRAPDGALVSPLEFIPIAEDTGLILRLGEWVLETACRTAREWRASGAPLRVAVNVSSHQVRHGDLVQVVERALAATQLPPQRLELEITESAFVDDLGAAAETLTALRRMGVRVALDDFGTGFSTLSNLMRLPIDALKIDRSFVGGIGSEDHARAVIAAVIGIAHRLGLTVIAEGVEDEVQERFLRGEHCQVLQGYLVGRPVAAAEIEKLIGARG